MSDRIALHEAAHAVVAEEVGIRPTRIELTQDGAGICYFDESSALSTLPHVRRELVVLLAGRVAEYIDSGSDLRWFPASSVLALECRREPIAGQRWLISTRTSSNFTEAATILLSTLRRTAGRIANCRPRLREPQKSSNASGTEFDRLRLS